jgi:ubiquitin carboxyl-terminal hydrolase 8
MGDSCSKIDDTEKDANDAPTGRRPPPRRPESPPPPAPLPASSASAESVHAKRQRPVANSSFRQSLVRVGSLVRRTPTSPTARASNYKHVHDAVALNFHQAAASTAGEIPLGVVGLRNLGNTCFLNSSLQCLSATIPLTDYFLGYNYRSEINEENVLGTGGKLAIAYAELMKQMWLLGGAGTVQQPTAFKAQLEKFAPQFRGFHQHDSQELLSFLLDGIHEDLNRIKKRPYIEDRDCDGSNDEQDAIEAWKNYLRRNKSLVVDIFQGQLKSELQCLTCSHKNIRFEPFMYLSLPISSTCRSLKDCLELYLAEEKLTGDNQWYCAKCKKHRDASKKTDLWILPPILIVHLKRFRFNEYGRLGSKNDVPINYPIDQWDLSRFVRSRGSEYPLYDLYAVSNHVGSLGSGHYTAYALNRFTEQWYEFNDSRSRKVDERTLRGNRGSAYVLFYNRSSSQQGDPNGSSEPTTISGRAPLIRRQSVSRPDLWPHTQVQDREFRQFKRRSTRKLLEDLPPPPFAVARADKRHVSSERKMEEEGLSSF